MPRNLDLTALRSFVAVADTGGVTRAAGVLHLTQSAVSMQLKRLEEALDISLLDRSARTVSLTSAGEQLVSYARRILALNDEVIYRMTDTRLEGEIVLGVPHDIVYPAIPRVLRQFDAEFPRVRVHLVSSYTRKLVDEYARGECDLILPTEDYLGPEGETLVEKPLIWVGAPESVAARQRPLRLAFEKNCIFRGGAQRALDAASIDWDMAVESDSTRTVEASVSADLAVHVAIKGMEPPYVEEVSASAGLPELKRTRINMYHPKGTGEEMIDSLADMLRVAYQGL